MRIEEWNNETVFNVLDWFNGSVLSRTKSPINEGLSVACKVVHSLDITQLIENARRNEGGNAEAGSTQNGIICSRWCQRIVFDLILSLIIFH